MKKLFKKNVIEFFIINISLFIMINCNDKINAKVLFGNVMPEDYVTGSFDPKKHECFVKLNGNGSIPVDRIHYLRKETVEALEKMYIDLKKAHPGIKFWIQSSTRNWYHQKRIWERRWKQYKRRYKDKSCFDIARMILRYSSMPGTSRHHWGTDFDINILENSYYEKGNGKIIYDWLRKNAEKYGFCQPYTSGRKKGYNEERWHWSYLPIAKVFHRKWNDLFKGNPENMGKKFKGGIAEVLRLSPEYVNSINEECIR